MLYPKFCGRIKSGGFVPDWDDDYREYLKSFRDGASVECTIKPQSRQNTRPEQNYYRKVIIGLIADEIGHSREFTHQIIAARFFSAVDEKTGMKYIRSTALGEWSTIEWENTMEDIRRWASDFLNLQIPLPNEVEYRGEM